MSYNLRLCKHCGYRPCQCFAIIQKVAKIFSKPNYSSSNLRDKKKRRRLTPRQRLTVIYNQRYKCSSCHELLKPWFEIDHIIPLHLGGKDSLENMNAKCVECHAQKTHSEILNFIESRV